MDLHFFKKLPAVSEFTDLCDASVYSPLPPSWCVVSSDIIDSTGNVQRGMYKQVNMAGASVIAAISNHLRPVEIPFTFTGDGAFIALPGNSIKNLEKILMDCRYMAKHSFSLNLAAGVVPVSELYEKRFMLKVAKFQTSPHITQAAFWGDGVNAAEAIVKSNLPPLSNESGLFIADFTGLECRWNSFPAHKEAVSLIIKSVNSTDKIRSRTYSGILNSIYQIYSNEINLCPIKKGDMNLTLSIQNLIPEIKIRARKGFWNQVRYLFKILYAQVAGHFLMRFNISTKATRWGDYKSDFIKNSDYRKFSGDLKMIVTGNSRQSARLKQSLENYFNQNKIVYGMHVSTGTITTCYVTEYQRNHIHFIDGVDCGYTKASVHFKKNLNRLHTSPLE